MGGGLMQLVAYGAQDVYLTGNPQITFFKVVYRRHTNFSMESIRQTATGTGNRQTVTVARNGDLVHKVCIESSLPVGSTHSPTSDGPIKTGLTVSTLLRNNEKNRSPSAMIDTIEVEIGGQLIDRIDGRFIQYYGELCEKNPTGSELSMFQSSVLRGRTPFSYNNTSWIPLPFWFCRNPGLSIPLIALQYHEVKFNLNYKNDYEGVDKQLYVDYIYLDTDERRRFAQVSHEYLIEQVQHQEHSFTNGQKVGSLNLIFNHPVKELIWVYTSSDKLTAAAEFNGDLLPIKVTGNTQLKLNGQDRFEKMDSTYFTRVQPWKYHTGSSLNRLINTDDARSTSMIKGPNNADIFLTDYINVYSFALKPEEHQPSGTCNFSRIDSAVLKCDGSVTTGDTVATPELDIYAINYNVLRIMSGMGGLAYSN
jgi:hypothetical protein